MFLKLLDFIFSIPLAGNYIICTFVCEKDFKRIQSWIGKQRVKNPCY